MSKKLTLKEYRRQYYLRNKERICELQEIYRKKNLKHLREYSREYQRKHRDELRIKLQEKLSDPSFSELHNKRRIEIVGRMTTKYSDKWRARGQLRYAVKIGRVIKQPCFCGEIKSEGHHIDYSKPFIVSWLCRKHHAEAHVLIKELTNYYQGL